MKLGVIKLPHEFKTIFQIEIGYQDLSLSGFDVVEIERLVETVNEPNRVSQRLFALVKIMQRLENDANMRPSSPAEISRDEMRIPITTNYGIRVDRPQATEAQLQREARHRRNRERFEERLMSVANDTDELAF